MDGHGTHFMKLPRKDNLLCRHYRKNIQDSTYRSQMSPLTKKHLNWRKNVAFDENSGESILHLAKILPKEFCARPNFWRMHFLHRMRSWYLNPFSERLIKNYEKIWFGKINDVFNSGFKWNYSKPRVTRTAGDQKNVRVRQCFTNGKTERTSGRVVRVMR